MHAGQIGTMADVLNHYNRAPVTPEGRSALLKPLQLNRRELGWLEAYLRTLSGGTAAPAELLRAPDGAPECPGFGPMSDLGRSVGPPLSGPRAGARLPHGPVPHREPAGRPGGAWSRQGWCANVMRVETA